jgi:hypothetical protein
MDPLAPLRTPVKPDASAVTIAEEPPKPSLVEVVKAEMGKALALKLVQDKVYVRKLRQRLREGKAGSSAVELMLWERAFGVVEKGAPVQVGIQVGKPW